MVISFIVDFLISKTSKFYLCKNSSIRLTLTTGISSVVDGILKIWFEVLNALESWLSNH